MKDLEKNIHKLLQKASLDGALTEDAVKYVDGIIEKNKTLEAELSKTKEELENTKKTRDTNIVKCSDLQTLVNAYCKREDELQKREDEMTRMETSLKYEQTRVTDHKDMFEKVFRNIETRRNVFTPVPGHDGGQYGSPSQPWVQTDEQTEKKE